MLIENRLRVSDGSDLPFTKTWAPDSGYTIQSVAVSAIGGTLGTGDRAAVTADNITTFYLRADVPSLVTVTYRVTLSPYAVITVSDLVQFA